jgi:Kef-type K+ transport system membrane component KefB
MADYRTISQEYARGGINAALLVNGGAAVALLSQAADLQKAGLSAGVEVALIWWAFGVAMAALVWLLGFVSTRYVDKHKRENDAAHLIRSDRFMWAGAAAFLLSLGCFCVGSYFLAIAF